MTKQAYIVAVQYKHGIEIFKESLTLVQVNALRRYFWKLQQAGDVGMFTVAADIDVSPLPDEAMGVALREDINRMLATGGVADLLGAAA